MNFKQFSTSDIQWHDIPYYIHKTVTDTLSLPAVIYPNDISITVRIKGQSSQSGTPSPQNPVDVNGVGELETSGEHTGQYKIPISCGGTTTPVYLGEVQTVRQIKKYEFTGQEEWNISIRDRVLYTALADHLTSNELICYCSHYKSIANISVISALSNGKCTFNDTLRWFYIKDDNYNNADSFKAYLQQQYANGTPVTIWYVLANETTAITNEPLMRIGDYADSLTTSVSCTPGENSLDVDTTVQPSEVTATFEGWHAVSAAHERSGGAWT